MNFWIVCYKSDCLYWFIPYIIDIKVKYIRNTKVKIQQRSLIYDKAAQLCYGIANNHPFIDGNKRTALHSMYVYLIINGYDITASQQDVENLIINVAAGNITNTELAYWLKVNTKEITRN